MELNLRLMEKYNIESYNQDDNASKYAFERAAKRLKDIKGFYRHFFAYILFTPFTIFINYKTYWDYKWFWYSIIPWGIAVLIHGCVVFANVRIFGSSWEQRKIEQFMQEEENKKKLN
jgi:hypothetical protein